MYIQIRIPFQACESDYPMAKDLPKSYEESTLKSVTEQSSTLDARHAKLGEMILAAIESQDLKKVQQLYLDRLELAEEHSLQKPHLIYLSNRSGLIDTMWLRFGNKNFDSRNEILKGAYI